MIALLARLRTIVGSAMAVTLFALTTACAFAQTPAPLTPANLPLPGGGSGPLDPYLLVFLLIGGGIVCLIAVVVTNNKLVSDYLTQEKYTK